MTRLKRIGLGLAVAVLAVGLTWWFALPAISDWAVNKIYSNVNGSSDREMPAVAVALADSHFDQVRFGGRGEGLNCSVPKSLAPLFKFRPVAQQFRQACIMHDYCYRHGAATYGYTQHDCDVRLQEDAFKLCKFVYKLENQSECQTWARKVLMGVRLGGGSAFLPAARQVANSFDRTSSYFEYDAFPPVKHGFVLARLAPIAAKSENQLATGIYYFLFKEAAIGVSVYAINKDSGGVEKLDHHVIRGSNRRLLSPPAVHGGSFYWWRRASLGSTEGESVILDPVSASGKDWEDVFHARRHCDSCNTETWRMEPETLRSLGNVEIGLSTHSCTDERRHRPCLVIKEQSGRVIKNAVRSRLIDDPVAKDRYKSLAQSPAVVHGETADWIWFPRRNSFEDLVFEQDLAMLGVEVSAIHNGGDMVATLKQYTGWSELDEPYIIEGAQSPALWTVRKNSAGRVLYRRHDGSAMPLEHECGNLDYTWLSIPPIAVDQERRWIVFSRPQVDETSGNAAARIDFRMMRMGDGICEEIGPRETIEIACRGVQSERCVDDQLRSTLMGQMFVADLDQNNKLDFILTQPSDGKRTVVRLNPFEKWPDLE